MHRVSKGAPEQVLFSLKHIGNSRFVTIVLLLTVEVKQILHLAHNKSDIERRVRAVIDKFAERGLRALGVAYQVYDPLTCTIATLFD
jgi:magnesium-transporting ATPase (P-type)